MRSLNLDAVIKIKRAIWDGETQSKVAQRFGTSQPTISRIVQGETWADVMWPDGSTGPLSEQKKAELIDIEINERVRQRLREAYNLLSDEQKLELFTPEIKEHLDEVFGAG